MSQRVTNADIQGRLTRLKKLREFDLRLYDNYAATSLSSAELEDILSDSIEMRAALHVGRQLLWGLLRGDRSESWHRLRDQFQTALSGFEEYLPGDPEDDEE